MKTEEIYPKDFQEFLEQFKDEDSCREYLFEMRCPITKSTIVENNLTEVDKQLKKQVQA